MYHLKHRISATYNTHRLVSIVPQHYYTSGYVWYVIWLVSGSYTQLGDLVPPPPSYRILV